MSRSEDDVLRFIAASFPSVWTLELVLTLKGERRSWSPHELIAALRASDAVVTRAIEALEAAGLASLEDDGVIYLPAAANVEECMDQAEELYRTRPNRVRRAIVMANSSSATAFAEAFRLRRAGDD